MRGIKLLVCILTYLVLCWIIFSVILTERFKNRSPRLPPSDRMMLASSNPESAVTVTPDKKIKHNMSATEIYNIWFNVTTDEITKKFHPVLNPTDVSSIMAMTRIFVDTLEKAGVTYMMYAGTLMGSYRHHGVIPWDDDIDFLVDDNQRHLLKTVLANISGYELVLVRPETWKFVKKLGKPIPRVYFKWTWPYVDIFFFKTDGVSVWAENYKWNSSVIFPLKRRIFWNMQLYAPRHTGLFLDQAYNIRDCFSNYYSHRKEEPNEYVMLPCSKLESIFPFVSRSRTGETVIETLYKDNVVINSITLT
jgi:hypothetical protein